jgi:transcriptional regulator with GAF, ATPase, and Fis domain
MESEFFGHEKGAFTGATQARVGRFALADGGTIFLDEVGELSLDLQAKLLRVLQEGEFSPIGGSYAKKVDVRVIAATNRDLNQAVREGKFRDDLFYRLNVFPIEVPPLRTRGEDVVLLASGFLEKFARKMSRAIEALTDNDKRRLKAYPWPGNVRELQNVIERAVITSRAGRLNLDRALPEPGPGASGPVEPAPQETPRAGKRVLPISELQHLERENILRALEFSGWRVGGKAGAALLLGMNPSTLNSRIRALGIRRPS